MCLVDTTLGTPTGYMEMCMCTQHTHTHTLGPVTTDLQVFAVHKGSTGLSNKPGKVYQMGVST